MNVIHFYIFILGLICYQSMCQQNPKPNCENKSECGECVRTKGCAWCSKVKQKIFDQTSKIYKCYPYETILEICPEEFVENPKSAFKVDVSQPMKDGKDGQSIQLRPQEVTLKLRPGESFPIYIEFKKAEDYPVDLYYLMDFSSSMSKHKNNLSKLGNKLAETMKNLTSDFQLGFGSFVDKVVLPFTSTLPSHLARPCFKCRSPYSYKNHMSLTRETERFSTEVHKAKMSGNIDTPEGTLDALMQAMACQKQINWREKARHIIVVSTDAPFHLAGDGKLGGIIEPHDGSCYLDEEGYYTHSLVYDYPSVSQINHKALENNMNIIFAVTNKVKNEYFSLSKEIRGASLGLLDTGENIADLIKDQYNKITTTVRLTEDSRGPIRVAFSSSCSENEKWKNSNECTDIKGGSLAHFRAHITVLDCPGKKLRTQKIKIKPVGINESLVIHLETICDCECSKTNHPGNEINSKYCSSAGNLTCGQCVCNEGRIGEKCECSGSDERILNIKDNTNCITNNITNEICSGRGECRCGLCHCNERDNPKEEVTGKFCECDNFSCERVNGYLCSGHGTCKCGKCSCDPGWSGQLCDCSEDTSPCQSDGKGDVCSGKGECICGLCHCQNGTDSDEHQYSGKYCQLCLTCVEHCTTFTHCVECLSYNTGPYAQNRCGNCSEMFQHNLIENLEDLNKNMSITSCVSVNSLGCTFKYGYYYLEDDWPIIWAETHTKCPKKVNLIAVIAGTIGSTVLVGLLTVIAWRLVTDFYDKREYEKFERERHLARWGQGENPLFKTATTTYENPTYATDSCEATSEAISEACI